MSDSKLSKEDNIKRIRKQMVESMKRRKRIEGDSDLEQLVYERMMNNDGEFIELDLEQGR